MKLLNRISAATQAPPVYNASCPAHIRSHIVGTPMTPSRRRRATPLAWLFTALALLCFAPASAIAQVGTLPATLTFTFEDYPSFSLNNKITATSGKIYYLADRDASTTSRDSWTHDDRNEDDLGLDTLFGDGGQTEATQPGGHDGTNDARSVILDGYTVILPTIAEFTALKADTPAFNMLPSLLTIIDVYFHVADLQVSDSTMHQAYSLVTETAGNVTETQVRAAIFQVLPAPIIILEPESLVVFEGVTDATYSVVLNAPPTAGLTFTITSDNPDVTTTPATLTFTTSDWTSAQTVTVMAAEDTDIADDKATLTHTASGGNYADTTATLTVTVKDAATLTLANFSNQVYTVGQMVAVTLPEGVGGFDPLSYTLTRNGDGLSVAPGLTFNAEARTISGTTTVGFGTSTPASLRYTVLDANSASAMIDFTMQVVAAPTFASIIADKDYTVSAEVNTVLPDASGGITPLIYALMPVPDTVIPGLTFVAGSHTLIGTPITQNPNAVALTYTVTDANSVTTAQTFTVTVHNAPPTVTSVGYYADEAATIPISDAPIGSHLYIVIRFSENVENTDTNFDANILGRPGIVVNNNRVFIIAPGTAFTAANACRVKSVSDTSDTSEYLCQIFIHSGLGPLQVMLPAGETSDSDGNTLAADYTDDGLTVVATPEAPSVTSVSHYSDAGRTTTISGTVTGGVIYSVIQFAGWIIDTELADPPNLTANARPEIFYQIGTTARVQFGGHATPGTPQNGTCALLEGGDGTVAANQSFWCRYNTRSNTNDSTYKIIVGTNTMDIIGQPLAAEYPAPTDDTTDVDLDVTVGLATLSIDNVNVNEGEGMATVTVTVDEAVSSSFRVDAMTADGTATAPGDYTAVSGHTLSFAGTFAGETQTFTVSIIDDAIYDGGASGATETVAISLTNLQDADETNVDISADASISITDNDYEVVLTMEDIRVLEADGAVATVTVRLNAAVPDNFSVEIATEDGSAIDGEDYTAATEELTFTDTTAGATQTFSVSISNDDTKEFLETLAVSLGNLDVPMDTATRVGILRPATATITIRDDDLVDDDSINLNLILPITFNDKTYHWLDNNGNGTAESPADGVTDRISHDPLDKLLNGGNNTDKTQPLPDGHDGQDDQRSVIIGDTVLILPTVQEFTALYNGLRSSPLLEMWPGARYWTSDRSAMGHNDFALVGDSGFSDTLDSEVRAVIFQVLPAPIIVLEPESLVVFEGVTDATYSVVLNAPPTAELTLTIDSDNSDVTTTPATLTFTTSDWTSAQTVTVMVAEDTDMMDETAILTHTAVGGNYNTIATLTVTVTDSGEELVINTPGNQVYTVGQMVAVTLPKATGGIAPLTYTLARTNNGPVLPNGLTFTPDLPTFNPALMDPAINGTATQPLATSGTGAPLLYTVTDANGMVASTEFGLRVNSRPTFNTNNIPAPVAYTYTVDTTITPLILPPASPNTGTAPLTVTLTQPPAGLTFDPSSKRELSGKPSTKSDTVELIYTITDANAVAVSLTFTVTVSDAPTFAGTILPQTYAIDDSVAVTLPVASDGAGTLSYTLTRTDGGSPTLPDGLTFNPNPVEPSINGMPSAGFAGAMRYTATDTNGAVAGLTFTMSVFGIDTTTIDEQNYYTETAVNLTLPGAIGGTGTLSYTLTPATSMSIPDGLTFDPAPDRRTLAGTPTTPNENAVTLTYTATDANGRTDNRTFTVTVYSALTFTDAPPDPQLYTIGQEVALTLPKGVGGSGTLSYTLTRPGASPVLPNGLTFTPDLPTFNPALMDPAISGASTQVFGGGGSVSLLYTVLDANGTSAMLDIEIGVVAAPTFGASIIADKDYTVGIGVNTVLPAAASGGIAPLSYTLMPVPDTVIPGLTFVAGSHTLIGTPITQNATAAALTYTVTDANGISAAQTFTVTVSNAPTFAKSVSDQVYTIGDSVAVTLPEASDGAGTPIYALTRTDGSPTLPGGVTFDATARSIGGSPSAGFGDSDGASMRYTATDTNGAVVGLTFTMSVFGINTATIGDQNYYTETTVNLMLPGASGGTGTLSFTLTPDASIPGLTFDPDTRTLAGTPTTPTETAVALTYTATDAGGRTDNRFFMVTVYSAPTFTDAPPDPQLYTIGQEVALTLPVATGGIAPLSYTLTRPGATPVLPNGLTFTPDLPTFNPALMDPAISGASTQVFGGGGSVSLLYTVLDANGTSAMLDIKIGVVAAPTFSTIGNQNFTADTDVDLTLPAPAADNGARPLTYTLTPLPDWLTFDPDMRTLTGRPPATSEPADLIYTVTDANGITATQTFTVTVFSAPAFADTIDEPQVYSVGQEVTLTLPTASGATPLLYTLARDDGATPTLPPGLTFNPMVPSIEGTPSEPFGNSGGISMRYTATDTNDVTVDTTFTLRVFGFGTATIDDQNYTVDVAVNLTLPAVGGGATPLVYTLEPTPAGLTFDATATLRTLIGTPTAESTDATLTYTVTDATGLTDNLTFMVAFNDAALIVTSTDVNEGDGTTSFSVRLNGDVSSAFSVNATLGGTATAGDYTADVSQPLNFTGTAGQTHTISVTLTDDDLAEGPETLVLSLGTPQGAGGTGVAVYSGFIGTITITDNDVAAVIIGDIFTTEGSVLKTGLVSHANVRLDTEVPGGFSVKFSTMDGTAIAGEDYNAITQQTLHFTGTKGEPRDVSLFIRQDKKAEREETFTVSLSDLQGTQADVRISDSGTIRIGTNHGGIVGFAEDTLPDREYVVDTAILSVFLPEPIDDDFNGQVEYSLTPLPAGLIFNTATAELSGMPTEVTTMPITLTYTAANFFTSNGVKKTSTSTFERSSASLTFSVTVIPYGVGSVLHYPNAAAAAAATTPITRTDLVSGGDIYSVVVFGANVTNVDAQDPAIHYTLSDAPVQFGIVAHDATLASGDCQALSATDTSRYTCLYSVAVSGANAAVNDPGRYTVSVSGATDKASGTALAAYDVDAGVTIGVRPTVESVKYYLDEAAARDGTETAEITEAAITQVVYAVVQFSENMQNINSENLAGAVATGADAGRPDINRFSGGGQESHFQIVAHGTAFNPSDEWCQATSDTATNEYLCHIPTTELRHFIRIDVIQENTIDLAGHTLAMDYMADRIDLEAADPPAVSSIVHYANYADAVAGDPPISGTVSGGHIYSTIHFTSVGIATGTSGDNPKIFRKLGEAVRMPFEVKSSRVDPSPGFCHFLTRATTGGLNPVFVCNYEVGADDADDEGQYQVIVGKNTRDRLGQRLGTDYTADSGVTISTLSFAGVADQNYTVGQSVDLTLPESTTGVGTLSYTLTQADDDPLMLPTSLIFDPAARTLKGTLTESSSGYDRALHYTVMDGSGSSKSLTFTLRVFDAPTFDTESTIAAQIYTAGTAVNRTLPTATGGTIPLTYTLTPTASIPGGLTFDAATRSIKSIEGIPIMETAAATLTYTVTDANSFTAMQTFTLAVNAALDFVDTSPTLDSAYTYTVGTTITPLTLPLTSGGITPLTYTLTPTASIPDGLTFDAAARTLAGTPTTVAAAAALTYAVTDINAAAVSLTFMVTVNPSAPAAPTDVTLTPGNTQISVSWTFVPEANNGGAVITSYTATATDTTNTDNTFSCTATGATVIGCDISDSDLMNVEYIVTVVATNIAGDSVPSSPEVRVTPMRFVFVAGIVEQFYTVGTPIPALTLPGATGGTDPLSYSLTPEPAGLTFDATDLTLKGTPTTATAVVLTYAVTDANAIAVSLTFMVTVDAIAPDAPTDVMLTPGNTQISVSWTFVPEANNGGAEITAYTATATHTTGTFTCTATGAAATTCDISDGDLMNVEYIVTVVATNSAGNNSLPSTEVSATPMRFVFVAGIDDQPYTVTVGENVTITLPEATGGTGTLSYSLTPEADIPEGLTFDAAPATRTLKGTPTTATAVVLTYAVTDANATAVSLTFMVTVNAIAPAAPTGVTLTPGDTQISVSWIPVPDADNGGAEITEYTATATHTTGTFTCTATGAAATACDISSLMNDREYIVTVVATNSADNNSLPSTAVRATPVALLIFSVADINDQSYIVGVDVTFTLPEATGGTGTLSYSLTPEADIPASLTFDATERTLKGTPTTATAVVLTYAATDANATAVSLTFMVTVNAIAPAAPTGVTLTPGNAQISVSWTPVPDADNGGAAILSYTATATDTTDDTTTTCTTGAAATTCDIIGLENDREYIVTVVATNSADNSLPSTEVRTTPAIFVFVDGIVEQFYTVGVDVTFTLPVATGGTGTLSYSLTPEADIPASLTFDATERTLKGTPTTATAVVLTYAATDTTATAVSLTFMVTVNAIAPAAPTGVTLTPGDTQISVSWTPVPDANNGGAEITAYTATATDTTDDTTTTCTTGAAATTCDISGLMNDREYIVTVVATNSADNNSMPSTEVSATPAIFVFVAGIVDQFYTVDDDVTITLPVATGGIDPLSYSLTPEADIPVGLIFDATERTLKGRPSATGIRTLTYTVTDSNTPPVSIALPFSVKVSRVKVVIPTDTNVMLDLDGDGDETTNTDGTLTLPVNHEVTSVEISTPPASATSNPPDGVEFNLTTDLALNATLVEDATVCLPTTSVPVGFVPVLYHYTSDTWNEIGRDIPSADLVCGTTQTFSPFAVGVERPGVTIRDNIAAGTPSTRTTDTANIADGVVIFTFTFSDVVTGFALDDISVTGVSTLPVTLTETASGTYTLAVTPTDNTNVGTISVAVREDAVIGQTSGNPNVKVTVTQRYDTAAPAKPVINDPVVGDNFVNAAITISGTNEAGVSIILCAGATTASDPPTCAGTMYTAEVDTTTWSYMLTAANISALGDGVVPLTAIATDEAGNTAVSIGTDITVDTTAPAFSGDATGEVAINTNIEVIVYDANATDVSGNNDEGIIYTLGGTDARLFNIDEDSGVVRYNEVQRIATTDPHHAITITATDRVGNTAMRVVNISVLNAPAVIITDSVTSVYAAAAVTFTFSFSEGIEAGGFATDDITVGGGDTNDTFMAITPNELYTLVVTPTTNTNDGILTVTVEADAVMGTETNTGNPKVVVIQRYDTVVPMIVNNTTTAMVVVNDSIPMVTVVYDANATDNDGMADDGITYTLGGTDALTFEIDADSGVVTYKAVQSVEATHEIIITATDKAGNTDSITVTITAVFSAESDLSALTVATSDGVVQLSPDFAAATLTYTADVDQESVTITTTTARSDAMAVTFTGTAADGSTLTIADTTDTSATVSGLTEGDNTITITVTAADGTAMSIYTITLTYTPILTVDTTTTTRLNEQILTRASQAMTASTLEAVARRVEAVAGGTASNAGGTGTTPALAYQFGGQSSLNGLLKSHGKAMLEDQMEYEQLFDGASFVVPLSADEGGTGDGKPGAGTLSLWGSSNFINLDSDNDGVDWDGQVTSINIGVDRLVGEDMLAGFALSSNQSGFDYVDANANSDDAYRQGKYNYSNTILHPYIGWFPEEDLKLWASVGFGSGEIEIDTEVSKYSTNTSQQSLSGGFSRWLLNSTELLPGNTTTLNLKGDVSMTSVDVEAKTGFAAQKVSSSRLRVLVSGEQQRELASGGGLTPLLEAGMRYDGGDGVTGVGVELGGGLRYANSGGNVTVAGNVRTLLAGGYDELGVDFLLQLSPLSGRGLSLSLHPVWGKTQSVADKLWNDGASEIAGEAGSDTSLQSSLDAEVGYGVAASILGAPGVLTPYTGMTATDGDTSRWRLGSRFADGNGLSLNLEGTRENTAGGASHIVLLRGEVSF